MIGRTNAVSGGGISTSTATATADDILLGKTAFLSDGQEHTGTIPTWDGSFVGEAQDSYPYADMDLLLGGVGGIYSGYCPSIIRGNAFGSLYGGWGNLSKFNPTFSSSWSTISVGSAAFYSQFNLTEISFLSSSCYKILGNSAFFSCISLATPIINAIDIGASCFEACFSLPYFSTVYSGTVSVRTWAMEVVGFSSVYISCNILSADRGAFGNLYYCSSININVSSYYIGGGLDFIRCSAISYMSLPKVSGNGVPEGMFSECINLQEVYLNFLEREQAYQRASFMLRSYCFADCVNLSKVTINCAASSYIRFISNCFKNCTLLENLSINNNPDSLSICFSVVIDQSAFYRCTTLKSLPENINRYVSGTLAYSVFYECTNFRFFKTSCNLVSVYSWAFYNCHNLSFFYSPALGGIQSSAFQNCSSLHSFIMYRSGEYGCNLSATVFKGCISLESYYHLANAVGALQNVDTFSETPIADSSYLGYYGSIYVRASLLDSYKAATNWAYYSDRMVGVTDEEANAIITAFANTQYVEPEE